jgi:hypothetical protein
LVSSFNFSYRAWFLVLFLFIFLECNYPNDLFL